VPLTVQGLRDGDRNDDARADIRVLPANDPGGSEREVMIVVHNPGRIVVLASARVTPVGRVVRLVSFGRSVRTAAVHPASLRRREVLGALPPGASGTWRVPAPRGGGGMYLVRVWLDQGRRRTRIVSFLCRSPELQTIPQPDPAMREARPASH
jgi:hypothetical protein